MNLEQPCIRISVRNLVEFILRHGDIDNRTGGADKEAMQQGGRIHRKIQRQQGAEYRAEVPLKYQIACDGFILSVEGRADGIIELPKRVVIDEIKGVFKDLKRLKEPQLLHLAQAKCYAYIYAEQKNLEEIGVQMTYCNLDTEEIRRFQEVYTRAELKKWFEELVSEYEKWARYQMEWRAKRNASIKTVEFPFEYRDGQKKLVASVYRTILRKKKLFIQAPTGVGKTMAAVFPAVKAVGEELGEKIFYLTAKTITRTVASQAFAILREQDLKMKVITLTAKEKICFCEETICNPDACPYAKGHFDRVNAAVYELLTSTDEMSREVLEEQARKWNVCPFEMALDVSQWVDAVICDYNYVFDPHVRLQRYFADGERGEYIFLVDEAHNLVERAREMYSAKLEKEEFLAAKKYYEPFKSVVKQINSCNRKLLELKRECDVWKVLPEGEGIGSFVMALERLYEALNRLSETHPEWTAPKEASEFFFHVRDFLEVYERLDEHYEVYMEHTSQGTFQINLLCVNPAERLQECCAQGISTIFFSATLLPIRYYKELLGQGEESKAIYAASPFDPKKRLIVTAADVSSKYTRRTVSEYTRIGQYIKAITNSRRGNYLVFFPSYTFSDEVEACIEKEENVRYIRQESSMTEGQREEFLDAFREQDTPTVGFCVMGGIFSEGIDLQNEAVIGVIIVGTGLPQTGSRQEILKSHYEKEGKNGFLFAYLYPGMNKVLQAAGRLIRTSEDYGVIALLDERFLQGSYRSQFPPDWTDMNIVQLSNCTALLEQFWADIEQ